MSTDTYYDDDVDDGPMIVEPDESRHFYREPPPRRRQDPRGPTNRDLDVEYDYEEEGRRGDGVNVQAMTGVAIVGTGVASLVWVFAGPVAVIVVAGVGVVTVVGRKIVGWRRRRDRDGRGRNREGRGGWFGRNRNGRGNQPNARQRRGLAELLGLGGRGGRGAAARRAGLLNGAGAGGAGGRGGARRRPSGAGGPGGRGPKGGPKGSGVKPKSGGGLLGKLKPKPKGATSGARSGGVTPAKPKGAGSGRHRANPSRKGSGNPLTRLMPGAKGRAARMAHRKAAAANHTAAKKARQAKRDNKQHRSAKKDFRAKMKQARFQRRQLKRKNRVIRRRYRAQNPGFIRRGARDFGRGLLSIGKYSVGMPIWFLSKYGVGYPSRFIYRRVMRPVGRAVVGKPSAALAAWATRMYRGRQRARMLRRRYNRIYRRPARRAWAGEKWLSFLAWAKPWWFDRLRDLAATRGRWAIALGLLAVMLAGFVYAARKARQWAWDGKRARHPFTWHPSNQQNTDPNQGAQPDPQQAQPDPQQPDPQQAQPDPAGPSGVPDPAEPQRGNPWGFDPNGNTTAGPAPGAVPNSTEGAPQMSNLTAQPGVQLNDNLEIPGGLHPVFSALAEDARVLEGMFDPMSVPDLTIYLNSLGEKIRLERDKWGQVGDQLLTRFPGFNLAQEFAGDVETAYTDLAVRADNVFQGYKDAEEQTLARWLDPRVNEQYADVERWPGVSSIDPITLTDGTKMHGSHTIWLTSVDMNLVGWFPTEGENDDYVIELLHWLNSLHPFFIARAKYAKNFVENGLVHGFPIEEGVADITMQIARGFADLADRGMALAHGYEQRNPYDVKRREEPKVNEHKRDVGNDLMTNAGA